MGLMFSRLARNFIKNGYFPTDEDTLGRIVNALDIAGARVRIADPCCGEGVALAEVKHALTEAGAAVEALGIEFDAERAWHAKQLLDTVLHADMNDAWVSHRMASLLFLNPPYGHTVADTGQTGDGKHSERLELIFLRKTAGWLQVGGVLVFIVPHYVMSEEMANYLCRHFSNLTAWSAPERQFKQMVVFGIKRRPAAPSKGQVEALMTVKDTLPPELPEAWPHAPLLVPETVAGDDLVFQALRLNGPELASEIVRHHASTLWPAFPRTFSAQAQAHRRPLRMLSDWHLALGLAAGQIGGFVSSQDGRTYLIKGATHKEKEVTNPELVKTGLDLLEFPTIVFLQSGYNVYTLQQAARRSWRIGQKQPVDVVFLGYQGTAQMACLELMAKKIAVAQSTSGDMPESGLDVLNQSGDSIEVALARQLVG